MNLPYKYPCLRFCGPILLVGLLLTLCRGVRAHPLDEANLYHFFKCDLTAKGLTLDYRLLVGGLAVYKTWDALDTDKNKVLSDAEKKVFTKRVQGALQATLDEKTVTLTLVSCDLPGYEDFIAGTAPYLKLVYKTTWPVLTPGAHTFDFKTDVFSDQTNLYIRAVLDGPAAKGATTSTVASQKGFTVRLLTPASPAVSATAALSSPDGDSERSKQRPAMVRSSSPNAPSDGSTVPQSNREAKPALIPGNTVTDGRAAERPIARDILPSSQHPPPNVPLTPAALSQPQPVPPPTSHALNTLRPFLTGSGGVLVALSLAVLLGMGHALLPGHSKTVVGAYLIGARGTLRDALLLGCVVTLAHTGVVLLFGLLLWRFERFAPERVQPWLEVVSGLLIAGLGMGLLIRGLRDGQRRNTDASESTVSAFAFVPRAGATKRELLLLGLSGGMVPCADALILLLFAHAQQKTAFGLLLVLAFGAGMAAVLIGVGLVMVKAGGTLAKWQHPRLQRLTHAMPLVSAALICGLGLTLLVSACIQNGLIRLNF